MVEQLVERIRKKDQRAMKQLYLMYVEELSSVCYRYVPDDDSAKDVLQNSFIKIFTSLTTFEYRNESSFRGWMIKVVVHEALHYLKERKRLQLLELRDAEFQQEADESPDSDTISADELHQLISELPDGYRMVVNLYIFEGYTHRQIAEMLGITASTSASQLYFAKRLLSKKNKGIHKEQAMREDWAKKLKQKLERHRKTPPPGLWESINQEMGFESEPVFRRWHWAAAAVFLALVGIFVFQNNNDKELIQAETSSLKSPSPQMEKTDAIKHEVLASVQINKSAHTKKLHHIFKRTKGNPITQESETTPAEPLKAEDKPETLVPPSESEHTPTQDHQHHQAENVQNVHSQPEDWMVNEPSPTHSQKWTIGINASSGLLAARASQPTGQFIALEYLDNSGYESSTSYNLTDYKWEHHLPVRFGLKLNYELSPHLNLQSGISYTYLHSKLKMSLHENTIYNQTLHYLGVPLGLSCKLWTNNRFLLYLSGGLMLEKCLNDKPWQWSVNAAAGVEYIFTREIGFYLEPSLGYYFDDGSSLEHYYKEHPLVPSFEFGLRLHVNQ